MVADPEEDDRSSSSHYYGDTVRYIFIMACSIMLVPLPYMNRRVEFSLFLSIAGIVIVGLCAGAVNARKQWTVRCSAAVSGIALIAFEYYAVLIYQAPATSLVALFINQLLALLFFFALYYSVQTLRKW